KLRDDRPALEPSRFDIDSPLLPLMLEYPCRVLDDVLAGLRVGVDLDPAPDAVQAADPAQRYSLAGAARAHRAAARRWPLGGRRGALLLDQLGDALGRLRALRQPVLRALEVELKLGLRAGRDRVEEAQPLDVAA